MTALALATALIVAPHAVSAAPESKGFQTRVFKNADGSESPYVVFIPHGYDGSKPYPVILFLHGAGETKGGSKMPAEVGIGPAIKKQEKDFGFITIIPQAETRGWQATGPNAQRALKMLDEVMAAYKTDPKRVYLTGLSMGGYGTWSLAAAEPNRWAAIVPVCGGGNPQDAEKFKQIPCWAFHGDKDAAVKVERSREMIEALKKAGAEPKYTEYPGVGHNSWDAAYGTPELWTWLAQQSKK